MLALLDSSHQSKQSSQVSKLIAIEKAIKMKLFVALTFVAFVGYSLGELTPADKANKDMLVNKGKELLTQASSVVAKLEHENKALEAFVIKAEELAILKLLADLETATDETKLKLIGIQLLVSEAKLQSELQKISPALPNSSSPAPVTVPSAAPSPAPSPAPSKAPSPAPSSAPSKFFL